MGYSLKVRNLEKIVKIKRKSRKILNQVSFDIEENSFVAIVGVSGAGKSTLLNVLSGYDEKNSGEIYVNDFSVSNNKKEYQDLISYVPQKEILHNNLTLEKSLYYSARLRIPKISLRTIKNKVKQVIKLLELEGKEKTFIRNLSGGEKKRASIAMELLNKPDILFLDEPTSGLDSNIEKKLMHTLRKLSDEGRTIVITAHTVSNLYLCDKILFMSDGGNICFAGSYEESLQYFHVKEFVDIYEKLKNPDEALYYEQQYAKLVLSDISTKKRKQTRKKKKRISMGKEIYLLCKRYIETIWNNRMFTFVLFMQAIIMAVAINVAVGSDWLFVYDKSKILLFAFSCAAMWLGIFNSVQEVVKERQIIKLEFFNNMRLSSYIISKLVVFTMICFIQTVLFIFIIRAHVRFPADGIIFSSATIEYCVCFFLTCFSSCMLGMLISSLVKTCEITLILTPIYMMFQLLFSGILVSLEGIGAQISNFMIGKYAIESFGVTTNLIQVLKTTSLGGVVDPSLTTQMFISEAEQYYTYTVSHMCFTFSILILSGILFMLLSLLAIRYNIKKTV